MEARFEPKTTQIKLNTKVTATWIFIDIFSGTGGLSKVTKYTWGSLYLTWHSYSFLPRTFQFREVQFHNYNN